MLLFLLYMRVEQRDCTQKCISPLSNTHWQRFLQRKKGRECIVQPMRFLSLLMISLESRSQLSSLRNRKIGNNQNFSLVVYEKGNTFQINGAFYDEDNIEEKERFFSGKLEEIETKYQEFLTQQGCSDDGVTFVQFIADNTDDILGYFENENKKCVNEKYATLILFLQYVHDSDKEL